MSDAPAEKKVARFVDLPGRPRTHTIAIEWPVEFDGKIYEVVTLRKTSMAEWRDYFTRASEGEDIAMPCFADPKEVIDALDPDDDDKIQAAIDDFFPKRFRVQSDDESTSGSGEKSLPTSKET